MLQNVNVKPVRFEGRLFFVLIELESGSVYLHGVVAAPASMTEKEARRTIDQMHALVVKMNPDGWNWDDLSTALIAKGFKHIRAGYWIQEG